MKFSEIYYEAKIVHSSKRGREVIAPPTVVDMPHDLQGKRLVTIVNNDDVYFTIIFDKLGKEPMGVMMGNHKNPLGNVTPDAKMAKTLYDKHYTPQGEGEAHPMKYGGEVRIQPPFKGYVEHPSDRGAVYFTDFNSPNTVYVAGKTIADKLIKKED